MIQAINAIGSTIPNTKNKKTVSFGSYERGPREVVSSLYSHSLELHELRKNRKFFKIFTFLNPAPKKEIYKEPNFTNILLKGELDTTITDVSAKTKALEQKCQRLKAKLKNN